MKVRYLTLSLALFSVSPTSALADMDVPIDQVTAYAGDCQYDKQGGGTKAANGDAVKDHTVENPQGGYAIAAVPQSGGNADIFNCEFTDEQNFPGVKFKASDHYGTGSDGKLKYDASHDCTPNLNSQSKPATTIKVQGNCGGKRGGAGDQVPRST
jgi:hypothetical protein